MLTSNSTAASAGSTGSWSLGRSGLFSDFSSGKTVAIVHHIPCTSNAPVQARWASPQRAGISTPNPPTVACNRLLGGTWLPHHHTRRLEIPGNAPADHHRVAPFNHIEHCARGQTTHRPNEPGRSRNVLQSHVHWQGAHKNERHSRVRQRSQSAATSRVAYVKTCHGHAEQ